MNAVTLYAHRIIGVLESVRAYWPLNRFWQQPVPVAEDNLSLCRRAIKLYLDTLHTKPDGNLAAGTESNNTAHAHALAPFLSERGDVGLELGGRGNATVRLKFHRGIFSITPGNGSDRHRRWENEIGGIFKEAGLRFNYHYPRS